MGMDTLHWFESGPADRLKSIARDSQRQKLRRHDWLGNDDIVRSHTCKAPTVYV